MNEATFISIIDSISFIISSITLSAIIKVKKKTISRQLKIIFLSIIIFNIIFEIGNILQWTNITYSLDPLEEYFEIIILCFFIIMIFYFFQQESNKIILEKERKQNKINEKIIRQNAKMQSLSIIASGVAHDYNNILSSLIGNVELLEFQKGLDTETKEIIEEIKKVSLRAKDLTADLRKFGSNHRKEKVEVGDISKLIDHISKFTVRGTNISLESKLEPNLMIKMDESEMWRVFQNIIINSIQAMPKGGVLKISADKINDQKKYTFLNNNREYIKISIKDEGIGIPEDKIERVIEPYVTTKESGTGLGLTIAHNIVIKHKGFMFLDSKLNIGTTIDIFLPLIKANKSKQDPNEIDDSD